MKKTLIINSRFFQCEPSFNFDTGKTDIKIKEDKTVHGKIKNLEFPMKNKGFEYENFATIVTEWLTIKNII